MSFIPLVISSLTIDAFIFLPNAPFTVFIPISIPCKKYITYILSYKLYVKFHFLRTVFQSLLLISIYVKPLKSVVLPSTRDFNGVSEKIRRSFGILDVKYRISNLTRCHCRLDDFIRPNSKGNGKDVIPDYFRCGRLKKEMEKFWIIFSVTIKIRQFYQYMERDIILNSDWKNSIHRIFIYKYSK